VVGLLEALLQDVERRADGEFAEVLIRILTYDLPDEPRVPDTCCRKCGPLLREYIRCKLALHRVRRYEEWAARNWTESAESVLRARVVATRATFHADDCDCSLWLWRGRKWREKQSREYQDRWFAYVSRTRDQRT